MCICISQWHIVDVGTSSSLSISGWCKWRSGERWLRFGCRMAVSVKWSYIHSVAPPVCLQIFCHAILVRKAAMCEAFMNHSWVSFHCSLHLSVPRKLNSHFLSSWTLVRGFLSKYCIYSPAAHEYPPLDMLAIFNAQRMSDHSSCTLPPCCAIGAVMLKSYKKLFALCKYEIWLLPLPYLLP